jgi:hypothetical protein
MKRRIERPRLLLLSFVIMYSLSAIQFYQRQSDFLKLSKDGIITLAKTTFIPKNYNADHYRLEFVSKDGRQISHTAKCGDERTFIKDYSNLRVIYLIDKPEKYWDLPDFENYSSGWSLFFFFGPYGLIGTLVCYGFIRIIGYFSSTSHRREFIKNVAQQRV